MNVLQFAKNAKHRKIKTKTPKKQVIFILIEALWCHVLALLAQAGVTHGFAFLLFPKFKLKATVARKHKAKRNPHKLKTRVW